MFAIELLGRPIQPCMIHAAGKIEFNPLWNDLTEIPVRSIKSEDSLAVITWNQPNKNYSNYKQLGLFEKYCARLKINCTVLSSDKAWTNRLKIPLTLEFLKTTNKDFVLGADSSDVFAYGLPSIDLLDQTNCDMLLNSERQFWPGKLSDIKLFEETCEQGYFRYLNSGLWIARRCYAIKVFEKLNGLVNANACPEFHKSDQVLFKTLYMTEYPKMKLDTMCQAFLNISHLTSEELVLRKTYNREFL